MKKSEILKTYSEVSSKNNYFNNIDEYIDYLRGRHDKYLILKPKRAAVESWLRFLRSDIPEILYLGAMLSVKEDNMEYLDNALYTVTTLTQLTACKSGYDHCIYGWNLLQRLMAANRFSDIELVFPKENGLCKNGSALLKGISNLVIYLYYRDESYRDSVISEGKRLLTSKLSFEETAVVSCLIALAEKDFDGFSVGLNNACTGKKQNKGSGENKFTKQFAFFALGLYNFARFLYGGEADKIVLPQEDNFIYGLHEYQQARGYKAGKHMIKFDSPLQLLNEILNVELPVMYLCVEKSKSVTDNDRYLSELLEKF